ncbi:hypothetical protein ACVMAJ_005570 [Bradyrhizobium sp. USDA 4448]
MREATLGRLRRTSAGARAQLQHRYRTALDAFGRLEAGGPGIDGGCWRIGSTSAIRKFFCLRGAWTTTQSRLALALGRQLARSGTPRPKLRPSSKVAINPGACKAGSQQLWPSCAETGRFGKRLSNEVRGRPRCLLWPIWRSCTSCDGGPLIAAQRTGFAQAEFFAFCPSQTWAPVFAVTENTAPHANDGVRVWLSLPSRANDISCHRSPSARVDRKLSAFKDRENCSARSL